MNSREDSQQVINQIASVKISENTDEISISQDPANQKLTISINPELLTLSSGNFEENTTRVNELKEQIVTKINNKLNQVNHDL